MFLVNGSKYSVKDIMLCHDIATLSTIAAVSFGFKSADDYYSNSSSSDSIKHVRIPLLCIQVTNFFTTTF